MKLLFASGVVLSKIYFYGVQAMKDTLHCEHMTSIVLLQYTRLVSSFNI